MRIAVLSDPHGNSIALDAVLADIEQVGGVDGYWVLGDLCALGHDPIGVIERLQTLPNAQFVRGNTDSWIVGEFNFFDEELSAEFIPSRVALTNTISWTRGMITAAGHLDWLATLPLEWRSILPNGTRVLCVHAAPGTDDGPGFHPAHNNADMLERSSNADADLVFVGHTHWPMSHVFGNVHLVNASPINLQSAPDFRAKYVLLDAHPDHYTIEFRYVAYDREASMQGLDSINHPASSYIKNIIRNGLSAFSAGRSGDLNSFIPEANKAFKRPS